MIKEPRLSLAALKVLRVLLDAPRSGLSGAEISSTTKVLAGTLYPLLARLEDAGWVTSYWEAGDPRKLGRPRRRYYNFTGQGAKAARSTLMELTPREAGDKAWA